MKRVLDVWWDGRIVGQLIQNQHGALGFAYAPAWLDDDRTAPLSASLPKREKPFTKRACQPFFAGLLPEEGQREAVAQALGVSEENDFSLLESLGGEVAGAIEILPAGAEPPPPPNQLPKRLDDTALLKFLDELPRRPFLVGEQGLRLSLAGAQSKVPVVLVDDAIALPAPGQPTTHILKAPIERFRGTTENEAFVMRLAKAIGLRVAPVEPRVVGGKTFLLIERYDRIRDPQGRVRRIHQEDFCQALGILPKDKYAKEGGPAFADCFKLVREHSRVPALDVLALLDAALLNTFVGNADAHGKNFSILYEIRGPRLAPLYDLLCTAFYPELSPAFAMKLGKRATLGELDGRGWERFARDAGMSLPFVRQRACKIADDISGKIASVAVEIVSHGMDPGTVNDLMSFIGERIEPCVVSLTK